MSHFQLFNYRLILCLCILSGCQTGTYRLPGGNSLLGSKSKSTKTVPDKEKAETNKEELVDQKKIEANKVAPAKNDQKEPQKEDNPFIAYLQKNQGQKTSSGDVTNTSGSSKNLSDKKLQDKNLITPAVATQTTGNSLHDAKTLMLIETEIRDLPPKEQQEMRTMLAAVPAEQVPQVLKIRKLMAQQAQPPAAATPQLTERPTARPTAFAQHQNNVSPWSQPQSQPKGAELLGIEDAYEQNTLGDNQSTYSQLRQNNLPTINAGWNPNDNPLLGNSQPPVNTGTQQNPLSNGFNGPAPSTGLVPQVSINQPQDLNMLPSNPIGSTQGQLNQGLLNQGQNNSTGNQMTMNASLNQTGSQWRNDLQRLIATAEVEFSQIKPGATETEKLDYVSKQVYLRMLYLMGDQKGRATQAISDLSPADQEFWQQTLWAFHNYFDQQGIPQEADRANQVISQLQSAIASLQNKAQLEIRNVNFCQKITSFGNYDKFDRQEFQPGEPVLVYAEIKNFSTEPTADGQYRTTLKSTIEIHKVGPQGGLVSQFDFPGTIDTCRNRRQDYFHSYMVNIPERATVGPHLLKLTVEDQINHKVNTYTMNFNVK